MSQKRLNGMPKSIGSIRSHNETEKHIARNGISPSNRAPIDGVFIGRGDPGGMPGNGVGKIDDDAIANRSEEATARSSWLLRGYLRIVTHGVLS